MYYSTITTLALFAPDKKHQSELFMEYLTDNSNEYILLGNNDLIDTSNIRYRCDTF